MLSQYFSLRTIFLYWVVPPFFFIGAILLVAAYVNYIAGIETNVEAYVSRRIPHLLLIAQLLLLAWAMYFNRKHSQPLLSTGYLQVKPHKRGRHLVFGLALGMLLTFVYLFIVYPAQFWLQLNVGDIVPPGNTLEDVSTDGLLLFAANILLAPLVEENVYRGFALRSLAARQNILIAIIWSSIAFGLFHWFGGFWYMVFTAIIVGVPFAVIALRRGNIFIVLIAHFVLNISTFLYAWLIV